jgi:hypothetical protein
MPARSITIIWLSDISVLPLVLSVLNAPKKYHAYKAFVETENEGSSTLNNFYSKKHQPTVLGSPKFVEKIKRYMHRADKEVSPFKLHECPSMMAIVNTVASYFKIATNEVLFTSQGVGQKNIPRQITMYLCKHYADVTLIDMGVI